MKKLLVAMLIFMSLLFCVLADVPFFNQQISVPTLIKNSGAYGPINLTPYVTDDGPINFSVTPENASWVDCTVSGTNKELLTITPAINFVGTSHCTVVADDLNTTVNQTISIKVEEPNPDFEDITTLLVENADQNSTETKSFVLRNVGNVDLTNIALSFSGNSKYNVTFTPNTISNLANGSSSSILLKVFVPLGEPIGTHSIGTVNIKSDQRNESFYLQLEVKSKLEITDLDVKVGGDTNTNLENGDKIKYEAEPEEKVVFDVRVDNRFTNQEDTQIENVVITITIFDIDDGDDIELESDDFDLDADDYKRESLEFEVPLKVDEKTYDVVIEAEGKDENGNIQRDEWTVRLEVNKKSHYIKIYDLSLNPDTVECSRTSTVSVELINLGSDYEYEVELEIKNTQLGLNFREKGIEMDEEYDSDENTYEKAISFTVPEDIRAGSYTIEVRSYYNEDIVSDIARVDLVVKDCKKETQPPVKNETKKEENKTVIQPPEETPETGITIEQPPTPEQIVPKSFRDTGAYLALLILALVTATGAILMIIANAALKKKR